VDVRICMVCCALCMHVIVLFRFGHSAEVSWNIINLPIFDLESK
jgi:hypothetical protein